jgi:hypothetical protein
MKLTYAPRFVDRDIFMRYRGGGIGHKYMRAIEGVYENFSRERTHHKEYKHKHAPSDGDAMDVDDESPGGDEREPEMPTQSQASPFGVDGGSGDESNNGDDGGDRSETDGNSEDENGEEMPGSDSDPPEASDSDDVDSDGGYQDEPYGFGDL